MGAQIYVLPVPHAIDRGLARLAPIPHRTKYGIQDVLDFEWPRSYNSSAIKYMEQPSARIPGDMFDMQPTSRADLPNANVWAQKMVTAIVEVISGPRQPTQLTRWMTPEVMMQILDLRKRPHPPRLAVSSIRVTEPDDGVAEVCATVGTKNRSFAMALRLEGLDGRWRGTTLLWGA